MTDIRPQVMREIKRSFTYESCRFKKDLTIDSEAQELIFLSCIFEGPVNFESKELHFCSSTFKEDIDIAYSDDTKIISINDCHSQKICLRIWEVPDTIPDWLADVPATGLIFENSQIRETNILSLIERFENIEILNIPYIPKDIKRLTKICKKLKNLEQLHISSVKRSTELDWLAHLTTLKVLYLDGCRVSNNKLNIRGFPEVIFELGALTTLGIDSSGIQTLPSECPLDRLEYLEFCNNRLTSIPESWFKQSLKTLKVYEKYLKEAPLEIGLLTNLETLTLAGFRPTSGLPLGTQKKLKALYLLNLGLQKIPGNIEPHKKLRTLDLSFNEITSLAGLKVTKLLSSLSIKDNQITDLSPLAVFKSLKHLMASGNQITAIPTKLIARGRAQKLTANFMCNPLNTSAKQQAEAAGFQV